MILEEGKRKEAKKRRKEEISIDWGRITCNEDSGSKSLGKHLGVFQGRQSVIWPWTASSILPHITATWFSLLHVFPFYFYTFLNHSSQHITYDLKREILFLFSSFKSWYNFFSFCDIASLHTDWQGWCTTLQVAHISLRLCNMLDMFCRRRQCQPTPVLLPGKSHGRRSLVGYSSWGH